jgi:hypothetical protein
LSTPLRAEPLLFGADLTTQDCEAIMAKVLEPSATVAKSNTEET